MKKNLLIFFLIFFTNNSYADNKVLYLDINFILNTSTAGKFLNDELNNINKKNLEEFKKKFFKQFNENPNHISLLSYDLVGLVYYLSLKNNIAEINKAFNAQNSFKGKIGIFDIKDNKINHRLNFYQIKNGEIKEIFWFF